MAREREEFRRQQEQLRYEQEKRNNLKRGREYDHGYVGCFNFVFEQFQGSVLHKIVRLLVKCCFAHFVTFSIFLCLNSLYERQLLISLGHDVSLKFGTKLIERKTETCKNYPICF